MDNVAALDPTWLIAGAVVAAIVSILKRFTKLDVAERQIKQGTALAFSLLSVAILPRLAGQPLPALGLLISQVVTTWASANLTYSVAKTVLGQFFPAPKKSGAKKVPKKAVKPETQPVLDTNEAIARNVKHVQGLAVEKLAGFKPGMGAVEIKGLRVKIVKARLKKAGLTVGTDVEAAIVAALK